MGNEQRFYMYFLVNLSARKKNLTLSVCVEFLTLDEELLSLDL